MVAISACRAACSAPPPFCGGSSRRDNVIMRSFEAGGADGLVIAGRVPCLLRCLLLRILCRLLLRILSIGRCSGWLSRSLPLRSRRFGRRRRRVDYGRAIAMQKLDWALTFAPRCAIDIDLLLHLIAIVGGHHAQAAALHGALCGNADFGIR